MIAHSVIAHSVIASGFPERTDMAALAIGPTGLGFAMVMPVWAPLFLNEARWNAPLGLAIAHGGDILTVNGGDGNLVETTPGGAQVTVKSIDTSNMGAGTLLDLAISRSGEGVYFVDDGDNTFDLLR